jgi:hypothetical protein
MKNTRIIRSSSNNKILPMIKMLFKKYKMKLLKMIISKKHKLFPLKKNLLKKYKKPMKMAQSIMDKKKMEKDTDTVNSIMLMEAFMKENGSLAEWKD